MENLKRKKNIFLGVILSLCILLLTACGNKINEEDYARFSPEEFPRVFLGEEYERIYAQTGEEFKEQVSLNQFKKSAKSFNKDIEAFHLQTSLPIIEYTQYIWIDNSGTKGVTALFDDDDTVAGLQIFPISSFPETDQIYTETEFIMPITETYFTFWGGTNVAVNYHYAVEAQRYAYDLVIQKDNHTYSGDATKNESYYAFGKEVIAPADGKVVKVEGNVKDNDPVGEMNTEDFLGNYVMIEHPSGEISLIAHLKHQSLTVAVGDTVKTGDVIGLVGNSGNSSEAHIHFQVMDSTDILTANSIRIRFKDNIDPIRGDYVEPQI